MNKEEKRAKELFQNVRNEDKCLSFKTRAINIQTEIIITLKKYGFISEFENEVLKELQKL